MVTLIMVVFINKEYILHEFHNFKKIIIMYFRFIIILAH